jgi:hypothetical protein
VTRECGRDVTTSGLAANNEEIYSVSTFGDLIK